MYQIIFYDSSALKKDIKKLKKNTKDWIQVKNTVQKFSADPLQNSWNTKKMEPKEKNIFRLKFGNIRIQYDIDFGNKNIVVYRMGYRKDIYK